MIPADPAGHDPGESFVRAVVMALCGGGALLTIALVLTMSRWMIG